MKYIRVALIIIGTVLFLVSGIALAQDDESVTVGIVAFREDYVVMIDSFVQRMAELGYVEGENITYFRGGTAETDTEMQHAIVQEVVEAGVDLIFVPNEPEAVVVHEFTDTIPTVFAMAGDPVGSGLVDDLTRPGRNFTGVAMLSGFTARRLQLLKEVDPTVEQVYIPYVLDNLTGESQLAEMEEIAEALGIELVVGEIADREGMLEAIATLPEDIDAIFFFSGEQLSQSTYPQWFAASVRLRAGLCIPIYGRIPGVLMGYGPDVLVNATLAADIADLILRGADPADVPVQNAESALMVNLQMAQGLGIEVPRAALRQAGIIMRAGDEDEPEETESPEPDADDE
jgi:putative ABC transport system substrate-binding protein